MKIQVDNIPEDDRAEFKTRMLEAISSKGNVYITPGDTAVIETQEPYIITEESLTAKARTKKAIHKALAEFRVYQFNK